MSPLLITLSTSTGGLVGYGLEGARGPAEARSVGTESKDEKIGSLWA